MPLSCGYLLIRLYDLLIYSGETHDQNQRHVHGMHCVQKAPTDHTSHFPRRREIAGSKAAACCYS
jgi:hypothetical protein